MLLCGKRVGFSGNVVSRVRLNQQFGEGTLVSLVSRLALNPCEFIQPSAASHGVLNLGYLVGRVRRHLADLVQKECGNVMSAECGVSVSRVRLSRRSVSRVRLNQQLEKVLLFPV